MVGTGDFTHPAWFAGIREGLVPDGDTGLFRLRDDLERARLARLPGTCQAPVRFLLSAGVSTSHKKEERTRKIQHLIYAPDLETVERFNAKLGPLGNLGSDGSPLVGIDPRHLLEITLESGPGAYLVPAHIWMPSLGVLGAVSGFDHVDECYGDLATHVFAVETGVSSDPPMNWRVSGLDRFRLVSGSNAHSPAMLGREASAFDCAPDYFAMRRALETGHEYGGTMELFPEEGKYHLDGHRTCGVRFEPGETRAHEGICPACGEPLTVGVLNRVESLADRTDGTLPRTAAAFRSLVPLPDIVGEISGVGARSKTAEREVSGLVARLGPELQILNDVPEDGLRRQGSELLREAIARLRRGEVRREAGYDGGAGVVRMFRASELEQRTVVAPLFDSPTAEEPTVDTTPRPPVILLEEEVATAHPPASPGWRRARRSKHLLHDLDAEQRAVAEHADGPLLVTGGPGSGKTHACTRRIANLIATGHARPKQCLAISPSRRAARQQRANLDALLSPRNRGVTVATFHGLGLRILTEQRTTIGLHRGFRVADETERLAVVREEFGLSVARAERLLAEISQIKRTRLPARSSAEPPSTTEAVLLLEHYQDALADRRLIDFDDVIDLPVRLLESNGILRDTYRERFSWITVDDFQDATPLGYRLVRALAPARTHLCVAGDPGQCLERDLLSSFADDYPSATTIHLPTNHRSTRTIASAAVHAVRRPAAACEEPAPRPTSLIEDAAGPQIIVHAARTEGAEADFVAHSIERLLGQRTGNGRDRAPLAYRDCAVLYPTESLADPIATALQRSGIPLQRRNHERLLERPAVRAIASRLRRRNKRRGAADAPALPFGGGVTERIDLAAREAAVAHELRLGSDPAQTDSATNVSAAEIRAAADLLQPLAEPFGRDVDGFLTELALGATEVDTLDTTTDRVSLLTLRAAKDLEFRAVFIIGCEDGQLPRSHDEARAEDEAQDHSLFLVGLTRARTNLFLSWARRRRIDGRAQATAPSPYLDDIGSSLLERRRHAPERRPKAEAATASQLALL